MLTKTWLEPESWRWGEGGRVGRGDEGPGGARKHGVDGGGVFLFSVFFHAVAGFDSGVGGGAAVDSGGGFDDEIGGGD